jgi:hypothetical protein
MLSVVEKNKTSSSIILFLVAMFLVHITKPAFIYNREGGFRPFGMGYQHKTVLPIWAISIILAIFSYIAVSYYILWM